MTTLLEITGQINNDGIENISRQAQKVQVVSYARVSSSKQRHDLQRQLQHMESFVDSQDWHLLKSYKHLGSGINDKRKELLLPADTNQLVSVYPRNTSRGKQLGCPADPPGSVCRTKGQYDIGICTSCNQSVNTHQHAA